MLPMPPLPIIGRGCVVRCPLLLVVTVAAALPSMLAWWSLTAGGRSLWSPGTQELAKPSASATPPEVVRTV